MFVRLVPQMPLMRPGFISGSMSCADQIPSPDDLAEEFERFLQDPPDDESR